MAMEWFTCPQCGEEKLYNDTDREPYCCEDCMEEDNRLQAEENAAYERGMARLLKQEEDRYERD